MTTDVRRGFGVCHYLPLQRTSLLFRVASNVSVEPGGQARFSANASFAGNDYPSKNEPDPTREPLPCPDTAMFS